MTLREKLIENMKKEQNRGLRLRDFTCGGWRSERLAELCAMREEGLVYTKDFRDMANMEYYQKWYLVEG